jgi:acyl-CoA synthetase (AMP-forming)/AMP-acid ligase II
MIQTVHDILEAGRDTDVAFAAPDRPDLSYAELRMLAGNVRLRLRDVGIGRNGRVAIVLPNGPEMATAFLTIAASATTAPLNPNYRAEEFKFYLEDLKASALLVDAESDSPAIEVARDLGVAIHRLIVDPGAPAGAFRLELDGATGSASDDWAEPGDTALVLHTSGTTSRPKIVPLSQANICASAQNISETLALTPTDRCLNIMPLFHIHGLMAAVLASIAAGASVFATPGFNALKFSSWLTEARPSWYTAVPTMHQAILARLGRDPEAAKDAGLRFIRSSSASLPPQVLAALEELFACPVVESYGMTEASHQMASNPLPPAERKPGSVGPAAGPEVAIMDEGGKMLDAEETGEIVIKGPNVMAAYENNPDANAKAFSNGWFRTGDQGVMDKDGYVRITGRLKEIINRGGEKISPREVDEVLLDHPSVAQAVTFAIPHPKLGEEVGAAVVLADGAEPDERGIRDFVAGRLADFKVPRKIVFLDEIPKGATGKLTRIGLAEKLGITA